MEDGYSRKRCSYIIIENNSNMNEHTYADWYKEYIKDNTGIWLGNGVEEQYVLKPISSSYRLMNAPGISYGYVFTKGKPSLIKLLGMKEQSEENE